MMAVSTREYERVRRALTAIAENRVPHPDGYHVHVPPTIQAFAQGALAERAKAA
jgi:hypothetical protein